MNRRAFITVLGGSIFAAPLVAGGQQSGKVYRLGILSPHRAPTRDERVQGPFGKRLRELGWIPGENLIIEDAFGDGVIE